jgi:hypothetical protein
MSVAIGRLGCRPCRTNEAEVKGSRREKKNSSGIELRGYIHKADCR